MLTCLGGCSLGGLRLFFPGLVSLWGVGMIPLFVFKGRGRARFHPLLWATFLGAYSRPNIYSFDFLLMFVIHNRTFSLCCYNTQHFLLQPPFPHVPLTPKSSLPGTPLALSRAPLSPHKRGRYLKATPEAYRYHRFFMIYLLTPLFHTPSIHHVQAPLY